MELAEKDPHLREEAIRLFNESKVSNPAQQRCYYNLAIIASDQAAEKRTLGPLHEYCALLDQVRNLLLTALKQKKWEGQPSSEASSLVHYNLSCCLCRLEEVKPTTGRDNHTHLLDEAIKHLQRASSFKSTRLQTVNEDLMEPDGDLCALARNRFYAEQLHAVRANFAKNWTLQDEGEAH